MNISDDTQLKFGIVIYVLYILELSRSHVFVEPAETNIDDFVLRVVNGRAANLGDVPYQIALKMLASPRGKKYMTFCGGAIISNYKLLSAAHCFRGNKSNYPPSIYVSARKLANLYAVAGNLMNYAEYSTDNPGGDGGQWRTLKDVIYPSEYKFPKHDISVVVTVQPFNFNAYIAPIPYAKTFKEYSGECLVSGYGRTTPAISQKKGDSGGPLVCFNTGHPEEIDKGILVGIVSGNRRDAGSFFTRVSSYHKFIERNKARKVLVPTNLYLYAVINYGFYLF